MKARVLIVDDTPGSIMAITAALGDTCDVVTADTGERGIELARSSDLDVILLDIMLPRMDGYDVCRAIRELPRLSAIPIVMISALDDRASRIAGLAAGADEFILKPIDAIELRVRVRSIVRLNRFRRLLEAEDQFGRLFHTSPDPIILFDLETGAVNLGNVAAADLFDPARTFFDHIVGSDGDYLRHMLATTPIGTRIAHSLQLRNLQDRPQPVEISCVRTEWQGRPSMIVAARDISDRLEAEAHARCAERAQAALTATAGLAHDFGNYLMTIQGGIDLIEQSLKGASADLVEVVNENIDGASALVKRITGLARGASTMNLRRLPLASFVTRVEPALRHLLGSTRLLIHCDSNCAIVADAEHLEEALINLVTNAKQAVGHCGTVTIAVNCQGDATRPVREVSLTVTDDGCGMTPEVRSRALEPYFTTRGDRGGTGLGLATVHSLVTAQGGRLQLTSTPGEGTSISMIWPCNPAGTGPRPTPDALTHGQREAPAPTKYASQ